MTDSTQERAIQGGRRLAVAVLAAIAVAAATPALASAATVWVSPNPVKAPFNSCASPGYNKLQEAININAPATFNVCKGTYEEQVVIEKELTITGFAGSKLKLPASPANSTTPCVMAAEEQDELAICGSVKVKITGLTVEALWPGVCNDNLNAIVVGGKGNLILSNSSVTAAGNSPSSTSFGCQGGIGVQVGKAEVASGDTPQIGSATIQGDKISGYQKNGITVDNVGSTAAINKDTITGAGPAEIGQNGVQISRGALAKITGSTISGSECSAAACGTGSSGKLEEDGAGVLFYKAAKGSSVTTSTIRENDLGVSHIAGNEENKSQASILSNTITNNRFAGVMLGQGFATVSKDTISKGEVGILVLQYFPGQEFGPKGTGSEDTISEESKWAIEGLSDLNAGDQFGSFTITKSKISGNPGTVEGSVFTNNPSKLKIFTTPSDT